MKKLDNHHPKTQGPIKAGTIMSFAGSSAPIGWLLCDGSIVNRADYPHLYAAIGNTWNTCYNTIAGVQNRNPEGEGEFRIPDLRGAFLRGAGTFVDGTETNSKHSYKHAYSNYIIKVSNTRQSRPTEK